MGVGLGGVRVDVNGEVKLLRKLKKKQILRGEGGGSGQGGGGRVGWEQRIEAFVNFFFWGGGGSGRGGGGGRERQVWGSGWM